MAVMEPSESKPSMARLAMEGVRDGSGLGAERGSCRSWDGAGEGEGEARRRGVTWREGEGRGRPRPVLERRRR